MKRIRKTIGAILWVAILVAGLTATAAQATGGSMHGRHGPPGMGPDPAMLFPMIIRKLDLSDQQHAQVQSILEAHHATFKTLFKQVRAAHKELTAKLFETGNLTADDLAPYVDKIETAKDQVMQEGINVALEIRGVLTPDQIAKASDLHNQLAQLHEEMRQLLGDPDGAPVVP